MNTSRVRAAIGLGLSLAVAAGCHSSSSSGNKDAGRDLRRDSAINTNPPCVINGTTYNPGESFTIDCVHYTCISGNSVTSSGAPCSDAAVATPDTRLNADSPAPNDTPPLEAAPPVEAGKADVAPGETAKRDTQASLDVGAPEDTAPPAVDTEPAIDLPVPGEDTASVVEDAPVVRQCTWGSAKYNPGATFACECNTCVCLDTGSIVQLTSNNCNADAQ